MLVATSVVSIVHHVLKSFCDTSWVVHSPCKDGGEGIWEAVCHWAIDELLIFYVFVNIFKSWLSCTDCFGYSVLQGSGASHLLWVPCPEWEIPL